MYSHQCNANGNGEMNAENVSSSDCLYYTADRNETSGNHGSLYSFELDDF